MKFIISTRVLHTCVSKVSQFIIFIYHARIQKGLSEGSKFDNVPLFLFEIMRGYRIQIPL